MTIHPEVSARGSLISAGDGSNACPPGQGSEGGKSRPLDHMRQILSCLTTLTKISTDIHLRM